MSEALNLSKSDLEKAINENLTIQGLAIRFRVSPSSIRNYLEKYNLEKLFDKKKEIHHKYIKDVARATIYKLLENLCEKVYKKQNNDLKASEIAILIRFAESDGLIESMKENDEIKLLNEKLKELGNKNLSINYIVPKEPN